jgi:predicted metal-binding membrane protein
VIAQVRIGSKTTGDLIAVFVSLGVSIAALAALRSWSTSPLGGLLTVAGLSAHWPHHAMFVIDWTLMCVAMMVPTALPLLAAGVRLARGRHNPVLMVMMIALGFVTVWVATGIVLRAIALQAATRIGPNLADNAGLVSGIGLVIGGTYMLSPIAKACAAACRSPMGFVATHWGRAGSQNYRAVRMGLAYGFSCFGCCWPLMTAMAVFAIANPLWMLLATLFMISQKHRGFGVKATQFGGVAMICIGCVVLSEDIAPEFNSALWSEAVRLCGVAA